MFRRFCVAALTNDVGGPDMAPHTPQRSERPGEPVALLYLLTSIS